MGGNQPAVTGEAPTFDDSTAGIALQSLYDPCVATVARQWEWDMARNTVTLTPSGNVPPPPWSREYLYPTNGIEVWQLLPPTIEDYNNPLPLNYVIGNAVVSGTQRRVIQCDIIGAKAVYNNNPTPDSWDAGFREAVVRLLSSELSIALAGKPQTSQLLLESGGQFLQSAKGRDN